MPELKALPPGAVKGFAAAAVDLETIKYSDKVREKARILRLAAKKEERAKEMEQQSNPKQLQSSRGLANAKQAATARKTPQHDDGSDSEDDDGSSVSSSCSSSSGGGGGSDSSSQGSCKASKPSGAGKRMRKGRKKVCLPRGRRSTSRCGLSSRLRCALICV